MRWSKGLKIAAGLVAGLVLVFALGPRQVAQLAPSPLPRLPQDPQRLQQWLQAREPGADALRADTAARIVWADPAHPGKRACAIVYLHGFSASQGEGAPAHRRLAADFGCNLYLPRLPGHGLRADDALHGVTAQALLDAASEALAVGEVLGQRVVLIGSSMGGALALQTAAAHPDHVAALVLWSPLVRESGDQLQPLMWPWGTQLLLLSRNRGDPVLRHPVDSAYWADAIHVDGYRALVSLTRGGMRPATYAAIHMPVFVGAWYKDPQHQDGTVSVAAMRQMFAALGTPPARREWMEFPDAGNHVIASPLRSQQAAQVLDASCRFLWRQAGLPPHAAAPCAPAVTAAGNVSTRG
jgi:pimeloyl-ACP methyl ester carboxylesterase